MISSCYLTDFRFECLVFVAEPNKILLGFYLFSIFTCHKWNMRVYWFCDGKNEFFFAYHHVLGLFMTKEHDLSDKNFPYVTRRCRLHTFSPRLQPPLKS
jgi:hypothetical protein